MATSALLAHQGGWDEILMILAPVAVIAGLLALAKRRVERRTADEARDGTTDGTSTPRR